MCAVYRNKKLIQIYVYTYIYLYAMVFKKIG